jgi:choline dehydrogenase-like flavoprotein
MLGLGGDAQGEIKQAGMFGPELRHLLGDEINRQIQLQIAVEQHADPVNRVTIDPQRHRDGVGNPKPILYYDLDKRVRDGLYAARKVSQQIFARLGIAPADDFTDFAPHDGIAPLGHFRHRAVVGGEELDLAYHGAGHGAGTHIMGSSAGSSVVDSFQRTHDHPNLYAVGCGSMPSIGTSNPTLTMAALALRSAEKIHRDLAELHQPVTLATEGAR